MALQSSFGPPPASSNPEPLVKGPQAVASLLARGGYVIYVRHGRTQYEQIKLERTNRANGSFSLIRCETQRQLSEEGRAGMKATGEQFRAVRIPLDTAFTSLHQALLPRHTIGRLLCGRCSAHREPVRRGRSGQRTGAKSAHHRLLFATPGTRQKHLHDGAAASSGRPLDF